MSYSSLFTAASFRGVTQFDVSRTGKLDGLGMASWDTASSQLAGVRGTKYVRSLMRRRQITLEFLTYVEDESDYAIKRQELINGFSPEDGEGELYLEVQGQPYIINCVPESLTVGWPKYPYFETQVQFVAYDPVIYSYQSYGESGVAVPGGGGATFPLTFPITFTTQHTGVVNLNNDGNTASYPVITLSNDLTNPLITNLTTGETFQLNITTQVGDSVVIDMLNRTVIKNGDTSLNISIAAGSDWWAIQPGTNSIKITTGSSGDTGRTSISYKYAWSQI